MSAGLVSSGRSEEPLSQASSQLLQLPEILGVLWLEAAPLQSLPPSSHGLSVRLCPVCPSVLLFRTPVVGFRAHRIQSDLILTTELSKDAVFRQGHI